MFIKVNDKGIRVSCAYDAIEDIPDDIIGEIIEISEDELGLFLNDYLRDPETGEFKEIPPYVPTLDELKASKISAAKTYRDAAEIAPIEHEGNTYDFDAKSRDRLDIALKSLSAQGEGATINWTMADNTTVTITAADIMGVFITSAVRSNALHEQYRAIKEKIEAAQTVEEVEAIEVGGAE